MLTIEEIRAIEYMQAASYISKDEAEDLLRGAFGLQKRVGPNAQPLSGEAFKKTATEL